jgi:prepilin-type N-terminal cleavage/methylation domain-containing protein/prepilin-type processing-associated H-X9-DG protein
MESGNIFARNSSRKITGFSLIEMLVVIGIVTLLAGLLLPALSASKVSAQRIKCMGNLRQVMIATASYVQDTGVYPPLFIDAQDKSTNFFWPELLQPYTGNTWYEPLYTCPSFASVARTVRDSWWDTNKILLRAAGVAISQRGSYDMNSCGVGFWSDGLGIGGESPLRSGVMIPCKESKVRNPASLVAFGDSVTQGLIDSRGHFVISTYMMAKNYGGWPINLRRHRGIFNAAFCDGHVESLKRSLLFQRSEQNVRRWNNDDQPHRELWPDFWSNWGPNSY